MSKEYLRGDEQIIKDILKEYRGKTRYISSFEAMENSLISASKTPVIDLPFDEMNKENPLADPDLAKKMGSHGMICFSQPFFAKCVYRLKSMYMYVDTSLTDNGSGEITGFLYAGDADSGTTKHNKNHSPINNIFIPFTTHISKDGHYTAIRLKNKIAKLSVKRYFGLIRKNANKFQYIELIQYRENIQKIGKDHVKRVESMGDELINKTIKEDMTSIPVEEHPDYYSAVTEVCEAVKDVMDVLGWIHINDYFSVEVTSPKHDKAIRAHKGNPALMPSGPKVKMIQKKIIDTMRETVGNEGEGSSIAPHHRRGTWITLRADRYRNHPMYQVENGIYRKESWVGPREFITEGNVYKVLD